jgi:peptidoglycan/LPS O-acetylase OafA/YrhL
MTDASTATLAPPEPYSSFKAQRRFGSLDGLRCIAVLGVIWHHTRGHDMLGIAAHGGEGVTLFFAISGFLITTLLLRERTIDLKGFYWRRTLRIFPLYYTVLAAYVVLTLIFEHGERRIDFFNNLPWYLTYTSNLSVQLMASGTIFYFAWSLAAEEQFYLVWPWVEKYLKPVPIMLVLLAVILSVRTPIPVAICLGVLCAHLLNDRTGYRIAYRLFGNRYSSLLMFALLLLALDRDAYIPFAAAALVLSCVIREDHVLAPVLQLKAIAYVGMISYGMYLMHMICFNIVKRVYPDSPFLLTTILTIAAAAVSYRYYESWFLALRGRVPRTVPVAPAEKSAQPALR